MAARFPRQLRRVRGQDIDAYAAAAASGRGKARLWSARRRGHARVLRRASAQAAADQAAPRPRHLSISVLASRSSHPHFVALDSRAVELIDRTMIDLGRDIAIYRRTIDRMTIGVPKSLFIVEFHGFEDARCWRGLADLEAMMADLGFPGGVIRATAARFPGQIAEVREAGLNIMMSMKGERQADLPSSRIRRSSWRTSPNTRTSQRGDRAARHPRHMVAPRFRRLPSRSASPQYERPRRRSAHARIAEECFALVREYKGSHSGEHGDGIAEASSTNRCSALASCGPSRPSRTRFDPIGHAQPEPTSSARRASTIAQLFRYPPSYRPDPGFQPRLDWSQYPGPLGGLIGAVEMCNNNGHCRRSSMRA